MASNGDDQKNSQAETSKYEPQKQTPETRDELSPVIDILQPPPAPPTYPPTDKKRYGWRENTKFALEVVGLCVLIVYTVFAGLQWLQIRWTNRLTREALDGSNQSLQKTLDKMQGEIGETRRLADNTGKQADFLRKQIVGTQSALVQLDQPQLVDWDPIVRVVLANRGHSLGHVSATVVALRIRAGGSKVVVATKHKPSIPVTNWEWPGKSTLEIQVDITKGPYGFSAADFRSIIEDTPVPILQVSGSYSWDDGYGTEYSDRFCYSWLAHPWYIRKAGRPTDKPQPINGSAEFVTCETWKRERTKYLNSIYSPQ